MQQKWVAFDTETTGVDTERDLILSAAVIALRPHQDNTSLEFWLDWDVDIPEGATAIHGLTRQFLAEHGEPPGGALARIVSWLSGSLNAGYALVGMNLVFDLTMLYHNCLRVGIQTLDQYATIHPVIDAMVLDKHVDPYRRGKRNLTALTELYRVPLGDQAHGATADAIAAARVCWRIGQIYPKLGAMDAADLHVLQMQAKKDQDASFRRYLEKNNRPVDGCDGVWPIRYPEMVLL